MRFHSIKQNSISDSNALDLYIFISVVLGKSGFEVTRTLGSSGRELTLSDSNFVMVMKEHISSLAFTIGVCKILKGEFYYIVEFQCAIDERQSVGMAFFKYEVPQKCGRFQRIGMALDLFSAFVDIAYGKMIATNMLPKWKKNQSERGEPPVA